MAIKNIWRNIFLVIFVCMQFMKKTKSELKIKCDMECLENQNRTHICKETFKTTIYYYDVLELKCQTSNCYKSKKNAVFESGKECEESCANCSTLLKKFKPNDECLRPIDYSSGNTTELVKEPIVRWVFSNRQGICGDTTLNSEGNEMYSNWALKGGLLISSQQECEKRCPPIV